MGGGGGGLCKVESLKSAEKWQCSSVFKMESRKLPPCSTEAMVGRPKDRQRELRPDKVHCRAVRLGPFGPLLAPCLTVSPVRSISTPVLTITTVRDKPAT